MAGHDSRSRKTLLIAAEPARESAHDSPHGSARQTEPVDAEWWEDGPADGTGTDGADWRARWDRTRDFFATRAPRRHDGYARRREQERQRDSATSSLTERDHLKLLHDDIRDAGDKYMESLRRSMILVPGFNDDERSHKLSAMQRVYAETMVMAGMRPLTEGVNAAAVVRVMSTMAAMYMLSPNFRHVVKDRFEPISAAIQHRIDAKAETKMNWAQQQAAQLTAGISTTNRDAAPVDPNVLVSRTWQQRYDDLKFRERGHREMFTARSAGLTEVALTENAFAALRQPGADTEQIIASYTTMIDRLYRQAEEDGLSRQEVAKASHVVLGERILDDPRVQVMVDGLAHGQWQMAAPHDERITGTDHVHRIWRGEFEDCTGQTFDPTRYAGINGRGGVRGAFTLRSQMGRTEHQARMSQTMAMTMSQAAAHGDLEAFNQDLVGYMLGCVARVENIDGQDMVGVMPQRLYQSRTMQAAMAADGVTEKEQRLLYSNAYADALEAVDAAYPEFARRWAQRYGPGWQQFTTHVGNDPAEAYDRWQAQQGTASDTSTTSQPGADRPPPGPADEDEYHA
ncbi:hypothetical protein F1D05_09590 [Kribbella qitaiheensis]|uniref:Uncharacterized protein n=1 Tax=Kribbella qitaiheensis TaxID=1544730 RepID=A0A7G6WVS7_9ACTN|nr:hypothetical protein [Kribbella qitaiheensis]QNE18092.1 hypothetical protein F1D05_09590 [Kribbella qitaiheensis]